MEGSGLWRDSLERAPSRRQPAVAPWTTEQLTGLLAANLVGATLLCVGWWQTMAREPASEQMGWLNLAVAGVLIAGAANALWLARGRRIVTLAKSSVMPHSWLTAGSRAGDGGLWELTPLALTGSASTNGHRPAAARAGSLVSGAGMTRFHTPACVLARGKALTDADRAAHLAAGRAPCEVCDP